MSAVLVATDTRGVATVTLNRPELRNAFDDALIAELDGTFARLARDPALRALVLTGAGTAFCGGADINWMRRVAGYTKAQNAADAGKLARMFKRLNEFPRPTVARVNGAAYAGGVGLVCCCDIAVAALEAMFAVSEVRVGLIPATIAPYLDAAIGTRQARRYSLTGEAFPAAEALRIGLVHTVASPSGLDAAVEEILNELLKGGPASQGRAKRMIARVRGKAVTPALMEQTAKAIAEARASAEGREGLSAFLDKRKPGFRR
jgi:methylglutaconyl-CoA hydratase